MRLDFENDWRGDEFLTNKNGSIRTSDLSVSLPELCDKFNNHKSDAVIESRAGRKRQRTASYLSCKKKKSVKVREYARTSNFPDEVSTRSMRPMHKCGPPIPHHTLTRDCHTKTTYSAILLMNTLFYF